MFVKVTIKKNFKDASMAKQLPFGIAVGLTQTVKDAQEKILGSIDQKFTIRNGWTKPSNKFGIKIKAATKQKLNAEVGTNADWLKLHETSGVKRPSGSNIAIPTVNVKRTKRDIIRRSQRPNALRGKRDVVLKTKSGKVLFVRKYKGKRSMLVPVYNLEQTAKIRKNSAVIEPAMRTISRTLPKNLLYGIHKAMLTAK